MKLVIGCLLFIVCLYSQEEYKNEEHKEEYRTGLRMSEQLPYVATKSYIENFSSKQIAAFNELKNKEKTSIFSGLNWLSLGPSQMGGRITDIAAPKNSYFTYYVAAASGGVWKTENNGSSWTPIFDGYSSITIGDIAVSESNPDIIWVGTGENNSLRSSYSGTGVFKSTDAGKTFQYMGLPDSHHIGRIIIHPTNPDIVYIAVIGHLYTSNEERGIYKTVDGGKSWNKILDKGKDIGFIEISFAVNNPSILFAAAWERSRKAWDFVESGKGSGIYKSTDEGKSWRKLTNGFPNDRFVGRIGFGTSQAAPNVIYAVLDNQRMKAKATDADKARVQNTTGNDVDSVITGIELYRSDDLGESWKVTASGFHNSSLYSSYGYFFGNMGVAPDNPDVVYVMGVHMAKSVDGGKSWDLITRGTRVHGDHHALWINPLNSNHLINGNDGGIDVSYDAGNSWQSIENIPIAQFYTVTVDQQEPYNVYGGLQDNGTWMGSSAVKSTAGDIMGLASSNEWKFLTGGDGFYVQVDQTDPEIYYSEYQFGGLIRSNHGDSKFIQPKPKTKDEKYRFNWSSPLLLSEHNRFTLYFGGNKLFKSLDQGDNWREISPDLSKQDKKRTGDVTFGTITTISESAFSPDLLYVGTDDGNIWRTDDGGHNWQKLSEKMPDRWVSRVTASIHDEQKVFASLSGYRNDEMSSYVYVSTNKGKSWSDLKGNLPKEPVNVIREDSHNKNIL
ncbi:MAG: glycosyl hydrolase, partial [Calditrichaeota bacterium]|nr:glycosyl hydrolase [Calditrichota bacterium]